MLFTSFPFIVFLAVVILACYLLPGRFRLILVLAANFVFYSFAGWQGMICVAFTCVTAWYAGRRIDAITKRGEEYPADRKDRKAYLKLLKVKKRNWMVACVLLNLAILALFKAYAGTSVVTLDGALAGIMPMGISFYTFKAVSHVIDAYRSKTSDPSRASLIKVALYVSWFPEIVQGPLSRFSGLGATLFEPRDFEPASFMQGFRRVCFGFFKKLVIADRLLPAVFIVTASPDSFHASSILLVIFLYMITLYADFTGGIDITIGAALMMGVRVGENFNSPYFAKSIMDYWRRWHITMGAWFRDYLYYPLTSSKPVSVLTRPAKALFGTVAAAHVNAVIVTMAVWFSIGIWHGATWNFIVWGLANGVVIVIHQELTPLYKRFSSASAFAKTRVFGAIQIVLTFILMTFINNIDLYNLGDVVRSYGRIFTAGFSSGFLSGGPGEIGLSVSDCAVLAAGVVFMIIAGAFARNYWKDRDFSMSAYAAQCGVLCLVTLVFGCYGIGYEAKQFIYNQF
jgi:D-alanyl-lipoteichoic acid acyltransferase DltB (MBOAT superfamily)